MAALRSRSVYEQEVSKFRQRMDVVIEKGAYAFACIIGLSFFWMIIALLGWSAFIVMILLSIALTIFQVGFLWFLR